MKDLSNLRHLLVLTADRTLGKNNPSYYLAGTGINCPHILIYLKSIFERHILTKFITLLLVTVIIGTNSYCQTTTRSAIDSLHTVTTKMFKSGPKKILQITDSTYNLSNSIDYGYGMAKSHMIKARANDQLGKYYVAHLLYKESLYVLKTLDTVDYYNEIGLLRNLGRTHHLFKQYDFAITYYDSALQVLNSYLSKLPDIADEYGDQILEPWILLDKAGNFRLKGEIDTALELLIEAEELASSLGNDYLVHILRNEYGLIHFELQNYQEARSHYEFIVSNSEDHSNLTHAYHNIARTYRKEKDYTRSEEFFNKAIETSHLLNDPIRTFRSMFFKGKMLAEKGDTTEAIITWESAINVYNGFHDDSELFLIYRHLRDCHYSRSEREFLKYLSLFDQVNEEFIDKQKQIIDDDRSDRFTLIDDSYEDRKKNWQKASFLSNMVVLSITIGAILIGLIYAYMKIRNKRKMDDFGAEVSKKLVK